MRAEGAAVGDPANVPRPLGSSLISLRTHCSTLGNELRWSAHDEHQPRSKDRADGAECPGGLIRPPGMLNGVRPTIISGNIHS